MFKVMKKFSGLIYTLLLLSLGACGILGGGSSKKNPRGQLVGTLDREGFEMSAQYGVYQIVEGQNTDGIGMKNFSKTFHALGDYDINKLYVSAESLEERGLTADDLMPLVYEDEDDDWEEKPSVKVVSNAELTEIMSEQDVCLSF